VFSDSEGGFVMDQPRKLIRIAALKTAADLRDHLIRLGSAFPCDDVIETKTASPLAQPVEGIRLNGKRIGNRVAIQPMEGWDGTETGGITSPMLRRWQRFGESGAKLIYGGEAMAVRPDGRANPNQLILSEANLEGLVKLRDALAAAHCARFGGDDDLVIGFQLTHSGRFCKPNSKTQMEPRVAYRHPLLDSRFGVIRADQVWTDGELEILIDDYVRAARIARDAGADFVDIKHCHGYLLHEFLGAFTRPGKFGGSFENRTRMLKEIVQRIRADGNKIDIAVRLSAFDLVPFKPDPALSSPQKPGPGIPEDFSKCLPYHYGFGINPSNPLEYDLSEPARFLELCVELGINLVNLSAGSPYYNPHIQRPAAYPPSDGYQPPEDPLAGVARQLNAVRQLKAGAPRSMVLIGTAFSYLQEFLPHVAQAVVREGWMDMIGLGRMVLSYPDIFVDVFNGKSLSAKNICRTFSDCTTAPRNGLPSGCYPLDKFYTDSPENQKLKDLKKRPAL
jgi:2,4-dienoyl-CoA reductase-like NADH-dependent reductase (Old Yellow Enzyme family)